MQDINFTGDDLIAHIGLSVHHPFFQKILRKLNHETPIAKEYPNGNGLRIYGHGARGNEVGLRITRHGLRVQGQGLRITRHDVGVNKSGAGQTRHGLRV